ncbi:BTAD domain-containing putative transcriptional regulator [Micromonospora sp. NPDC005710]|uniref:BTAD domain-containing putative transcriptional regulator n=1 Tax=Micromonospora sp. NPDC005710 TaxID=3157051 RepID=UPI0033EB890E
MVSAYGTMLPSRCDSAVGDDLSGGDFAGLLRRHRRAAGMTQRELAARAGLSAAMIRDLEQRRTRVPLARSADALAVALRLGPPDVHALRRATTVAVKRAAAITEQRAAFGGDRPTIFALGPLTTGRDEAQVDVSGRGVRVVLGRLILSAGQTVLREELLDVLWPSGAPESAINLVQTYVSRLRRLLEPGRSPRALTSAVKLAPGGYRLQIDAGRLDVLTFRGLVLRARDTCIKHPAQAGELLDRALGMWRGDPLDDLDTLREHPAAVALREERVAASLLRAELAETPEQHAAAVRLLRPLADRYPLHEQVHASLMLALAATGRQADAFGVFDEARRRLAEQLGVDPGAALTDSRQLVLRQQWRSSSSSKHHTSMRRPMPCQVPAAPADFTGRTEQLTRLRELLGGRARGGSVLCTVSGGAGAGKTAILGAVAAEVRDTYTDGQLYVDLQGSGPRPLRPVDALVTMLRALDVQAGPLGPQEAAGLLRSALAKRSVLVVLDDARDAAQVRSLLPGPGRSAVLVASRQRLADLEGAHPVHLGPLPQSEAVELLTTVARRASPAHVVIDEVAHVLVDACDRLPLAIRIAGVRLSDQPGYALQFADEGRRLDHLRLGDLHVRAAFESSYVQLTPAVGRAFRLAALAPGADFGLAGAAVLLGDDVGVVQRLLDQLVERNLLDRSDTGRYRYRGLLRLYAAELARADTKRAEAVARMSEWYLRRTAAAVAVLWPGTVRPQGRRRTGDTFEGPTAASQWLRDELRNLSVVMQDAAARGPSRRALLLPDQLRVHLAALDPVARGV